MKQGVKKMKAILAKLFVTMMVVVILPAVSYCQDPPDPTDTNPDAPFDEHMNLVFLIIGISFAAIIVWQEISRRRKLQGSGVRK